MQFLLAPLWGNLSDRFGRRPILLSTILMTAFGHSAFAASTSLTMLFLARALAGIGAANISTAQAVLADTNAPAERSRAMALVGVAFGVGFVIGPALGGILFHLDTRAPAAFGALLAAINFTFVLCALPETRSKIGEEHRAAVGFRDIFSIGADLRRLVFTTLLFMTAFALMEQSVGLFIESLWTSKSEPDRMQHATSLTSTFLVVVGIAAIVTQGFLVRKWLKTINEVTLFRLGLITVCGSLILIPFLGWIGSYPLFLSSGALLALGSGMFNPSMAGLVSLTSSTERQGFGLAVNQSAAALGRIIGPTTAGLLFSFDASLPFFAGAILTIIALGVSAATQVPTRSS